MTSTTVVDVAVIVGTALLVASRLMGERPAARRARFAAFLLYAIVPIYLVLSQAAAMQRMSEVLGVEGRELPGATADIRIIVFCGVFAAIAMLYLGLTGNDLLFAAREWFARARGRVVKSSARAELSGIYVVAAGLALMSFITIGALVLVLALLSKPQGLQAMMLSDSVWQLVIAFVFWVPGAGTWYSLAYFVVPAAILIVLAVGVLQRWNWARRWTISLFGTLLFTLGSTVLVSLHSGRNVWLPLAMCAFCAWSMWYLSDPRIVAVFEASREQTGTPAALSQEQSQAARAGANNGTSASPDGVQPR